MVFSLIIGFGFGWVLAPLEVWHGGYSMSSWVPAPLEVWHGGMDGRYIVLVLAWLLLEFVCL